MQSAIPADDSWTWWPWVFPTPTCLRQVTALSFVTLSILTTTEGVGEVPIPALHVRELRFGQVGHLPKVTPVTVT